MLVVEHVVGIAQSGGRRIERAELGCRSARIVQVAQKIICETIACTRLSGGLRDQRICRGVGAQERELSVSLTTALIEVLVPANVETYLDAVPAASQRQASTKLKMLETLKNGAVPPKPIPLYCVPR